MRAKRWSVLLALLCCALPLYAGGPLIVGGTFGVEGQPFTWSTASEIQYRTDGGKLGKLTNAQAVTRVQAMFQVWEDVPTATIGYNRSATPITGDGDVNTAAEFNNVSCSENAIVFDADGSMFTELGMDPSVIGFAGPCNINSQGRITGGDAALNGKFLDGNTANKELTDDEFDATFIHEFGHFSGLDHSQINLNCLTNNLACPADDFEGLPTMFPILLGPEMKTLSPDDLAWISKLYPAASFSANYGSITGTIFFSDGESRAQGVNVIARRVDDGGTAQNESRRMAVSVVSGYRFTNNPGQTVTSDYLPCDTGSVCAGAFLDDNSAGSDLGSRNPFQVGLFEIPVPPGDYTVEVESIDPSFESGSSVGPLDPPLPLPGGTPEFWNPGDTANDDPATKGTVTVTAGTASSGIDIVLNNTPPRFDQFETAGLGYRYQPGDTLWVWLREEEGALQSGRQA